ncbi:MAG: DUF4350 domain-containing protein [Thermodesulfobacteriota bacterium]
MKTITVLLCTILFLANSGVSRAGEVLFDTSHRVIFHPQSEEPLGLQGFLSLFEQRGVKVSVSDAPITASTLESIDTLVLPGPMQPFEQGEIDLINSFVRRGGNLIVLLHISFPVARLTERFGIIVSSMVISEHENLIGGKSQDFFVKDITPHPVTRGVGSIALLGTWGLMAEEGAAIVASTTDHAWGDSNRNRVYDEGEPMVKVGVVAVAEPGRGKVVVIADDAPLANAFLGMGDNLTLAQNIAEWVRR